MNRNLNRDRGSDELAEMFLLLKWSWIINIGRVESKLEILWKVKISIDEMVDPLTIIKSSLQKSKIIHFYGN